MGEFIMWVMIIILGPFVIAIAFVLFLMLLGFVLPWFDREPNIPNHKPPLPSKFWGMDD